MPFTADQLVTCPTMLYTFWLLSDDLLWCFKTHYIYICTAQVAGNWDRITANIRSLQHTSRPSTRQQHADIMTSLEPPLNLPRTFLIALPDPY